MRDFMLLENFTGVIGAIDEIHIKIKKKPETIWSNITLIVMDTILLTFR